ncbi:hypothetical protein EJK55_1439 [Moraxella catarrhalis]|uniref:Uncharacterized protein n=1 Tax=Moraxella catarrhalis TaxID=480 RepID=A0A3S9QDM7_MORCA|nr:hypothetical protein MCR_1650 [Moraxella catarrhalis BBH18]AZQ86468.1 hypothetical protein EJK52_1694 [Moraxella catarrhalis]EKF83118.1 hypothetical protein MCRH_1720 [Moraxella catarrhalis RH4]AZQ89213.1 hypothetical protein EJK50_1788 [Moraxella catarrhalis]AZQ91240.1 hypothetical protein EJK51_1694 [Moraxella catarrhalis]
MKSAKFSKTIANHPKIRYHNTNLSKTKLHEFKSTISVN